MQYSYRPHALALGARVDAYYVWYMPGMPRVGVTVQRICARTQSYCIYSECVYNTYRVVCDACTAHRTLYPHHRQRQPPSPPPPTAATATRRGVRACANVYNDAAASTATEQSGLLFVWTGGPVGWSVGRASGFSVSAA